MCGQIAFAVPVTLSHTCCSDDASLRPICGPCSWRGDDETACASHQRRLPAGSSSSIHSVQVLTNNRRTEHLFTTESTHDPSHNSRGSTTSFRQPTRPRSQHACHDSQPTTVTLRCLLGVLVLDQTDQISAIFVTLPLCCEACLNSVTANRTRAVVIKKRQRGQAEAPKTRQPPYTS